MDKLLFYGYYCIVPFIAFALLGTAMTVGFIFVKRRWWSSGKHFRSIVLFHLIGVAGYLISSVIVFDFSRPVGNCSEEYFNGNPVAFGPVPRVPFAPLTDGLIGQCGLTGDEFVWKVYRPVCTLWRGANGYEVPREWRNPGT